jgi:hypothetical protein
VLQHWGPNLARHSTVLGEYHQCAAAVDCLAQRAAAEAGSRVDALRLAVIDRNWRRVDAAWSRGRRTLRVHPLPVT